ncbi:putative BPI/LBP family protein At1g04970 isoform X2 [Cucurbita maxima]|uniref:BPI/LBP family protein At1g04970 isoform X2 n=1 Tax=Cucurbita maxima TaxID=3661 RepID=A0A6J1IZJ3_CUCMA|nr:putative BPI/LBP family protein At1g04970 isoform X2 [Cucurbita maxima]
MGSVLKFVVFSLLLASASSHINSSDEGFISMVVSQKGLNFIKDFLIDKAISSIIPLRLPNIEKTANIALIGKVHMGLSDIIIGSIEVESSDIRIGETGVNIVVTKATANMSMKWQYTYNTWLFEISDKGDASVQVDGMNIGLTLGLNQRNGTLGLSLSECGCNVKHISIHVHGGASWLYQGLVDAFEGKIESTVEDNISKKIKEGVVKLDSSLGSLPREISLAHVAVLNVTFVGSPVLSSSSIEFKIDGLFSPLNKTIVSSYNRADTEDSSNGISRRENVLDSASRVPFRYLRNETEGSVYCNDSAKMLEISLHESVLNSASQVIFENFMHWIVDKIPDQHLLNTAAWKWIIPLLYRQYPDDDIVLNISASSPPSLRLRDQDIAASIYVDMIIEVVNNDEVIPVACISLEVTASFSPVILEKNLVGHVTLEDLSLSLKWSKIGRIHLYLIERTLVGLIKTVVVPFVDLYLLKGVPLPSFHGLALEDVEMAFNSSRIIMCSDVALSEGFRQLKASI